MTTSSFNPTNEIEDLTGTASKTDYTFDPRGVLESKTVHPAPPAGQPAPPPQVTTYAFDTNERLIRATTPSLTKSFSYDADGQRVVEQVGGRQTWYVFNGLNVLMELDQDKKPTAVLNPGVSKTRLDVPSHLTEYFLHDGLGSVVMLTDQLGNPTQMYSFEPFGKEQHAPRLDPHNRYRYVGLASDDDLSLTCMNARWYDPAVGRFVSRDPVEGSPFGCQSLNRYSYARCNPLAQTDISGRQPEPPGFTLLPAPSGSDEIQRLWIPRVRTFQAEAGATEDPERPTNSGDKGEKMTCKTVQGRVGVCALKYGEKCDNTCYFIWSEHGEKAEDEFERNRCIRACKRCLRDCLVYEKICDTGCAGLDRPLKPGEEYPPK